MRLVRHIALVSAVTGTYKERFGEEDPCQLIAQHYLSVVGSACDLHLETCDGIFWKSEMRKELQYSNQGESSRDEQPAVTCAEAESLSKFGELKESGRTGLVEQHDAKGAPVWYDGSRSVDENIAVWLERVLATVHSEISPLLTEVPLRELKQRAVLSAVTSDLEFLGTLQTDAQMRVSIANAYKEDSRWPGFKRSLFFWFGEAESARFDEGPFLLRLAPFATLYLKMLKAVLGHAMGPISSRPILVELLERFDRSSAILPILYRKVNRELDPDSVNQLAGELIPRASLVLLHMKLESLREVPREQGDTHLLARLEAIVSQALLSSSAQGLQLLLCGNLVEISAFISWVWNNRTTSRRNARLIFSLVKICNGSTTLETRRQVFMYFFSSKLMRAGSPMVLDHVIETISVPSERSLLVHESRLLLEQEDMIGPFAGKVLVRFTDTYAGGEVGPRSHWLGIMFEEYFKPGNGLFEYSDESRIYIKPVSGDSFSVPAMLAAGRLIALGIKYGITIGARLAPCGLYALRSPREDVDLESCVKAEDPAFVQNLNKLDECLSWEDREAAKNYLADHNTTPETLAEYKKEQLHEKGIGSIKYALFVMKNGVDNILNRGALEIFRQDEFELMVNGIPQLSAETLWSGIEFTYLPPGSQISEWLKHIIETQDEKFRFAFNRFVTGVAQPPVKPSGPWIKARVEASARATSLPIAATCFSNLAIPAYPDLGTFTRKLVLAVFDGSGSLELV